jgi:hypothetical protein
MSVLDTLKTSGPLPLNVLNLLSRGSAEDLHWELAKLLERGLVEIAGAQLPAADNIPKTEATVSLTRAGLERTLA